MQIFVCFFCILYKKVYIIVNLIFYFLYETMSNIGFEWYKVVEVINPSRECVQLVFESVENTDLKRKAFIIFEPQLKYIIIDDHVNFKRLKLFFNWDEKEVRIDFTSENYELLDKFVKWVYNH